MPPQTRYSLRQAAAAPPKGTTPPKAAPPKNTAPPLPPSPAPLTPDLQARLTTYITTIRSKHLKTPPTPRHANWTTIIAYALTLTTAAEATQFLAHAQRPGSNSASITVWISLIQRHEFDAIKRTDPPTPLQRATIESRLRDYAPGEQLASLWALYERVEEVPLRHAAEQGGTLRKRVWEELGKWQANVQRLDGFCPDMWMVVVCLLASVLMPGFLPSRFARGECRGKFDLEKVREELVRLLRRVAEVGEEEVLGWSNRVLEEWVEGVAEEDGGILTYWLVFGDSPEGMREEREAEERKEREEAEAEEREEREEEEMLVVLRERWARDEAADKEMRQRGLVPQRDIEDQESRDFFQLPLPLPDVGQYGQLVTPGIGDTPLFPEELRKQIYAFIARISHLRLGTSEKAAGWVRAENHVCKLMVQYLRTHNTADKAETEHFLRAMNRGGWDGLRLAGWIERKAVGQWQPGDPKPLPRTQKITETVVSELAKGRQVASLWALQERLQRVVELDGAQGDPVQREDPWGAFQKWRWSPGGKTPALFMFPVCLVASVICPDLLEKKFAKMGDGFELDVFRGEAVDMLAAIAEEGQLLILGEENLELEEWLEGWAEEEIPDSFQLVFHKTVPEMRRRRLEVQSIFKDWADEDEKDEIILS